MNSVGRQSLVLAAALLPIVFLWGCAGSVGGTSSPKTSPAQTYSISGTITPAAGGSGAIVTLSGAATGTTTASSMGGYSFTGLANGTYAITPSLTGYAFNPSAQTVTVSGANVAGINFTATPKTSGAQTYSISGTITPAAGGSGATVTLSGAATGTTTSSSTGGYSFAGLANGTYAIMPSLTGYAFNPSAQSVTVSGANVTGIDFTATAQQAHSVALAWKASTSSVTGYNVFRSTVSGTGYGKINSSVVVGLAYTDSTVQSGTTYYYVTTAVDAEGIESAFSNQVSAVIP